MKSLTIAVCLGLGLVGLVQAGPAAWVSTPDKKCIGWPE